MDASQKPANGFWGMRNSTLAYVAVNVVGMALFLLFNFSIRGTIKSEGRDYADAGDGIHFTMTAGPVFLACLVYGFIWGIKSLLDIDRRRNFQALIALLSVAAAWIALILILRSIPV